MLKILKNFENVENFSKMVEKYFLVTGGMGQFFVTDRLTENVAFQNYIIYGTATQNSIILVLKSQSENIVHCDYYCKHTTVLVVSGVK